MTYWTLSPEEAARLSDRFAIQARTINNELAIDESDVLQIIEESASSGDRKLTVETLCSGGRVKYRASLGETVAEAPTIAGCLRELVTI